MKGNEGMSHCEKGKEQKVSTLRHKVIHNSIPTSLFLGAKVLSHEPDLYIFLRDMKTNFSVCIPEEKGGEKYILVYKATT